MKEVNYRLLQGNSINKLKELPDQSVQCVITSPPYFGLRNYNEEEQIGLEESPEEYVKKITEVFTEIFRVLKDDGTLWLNLGDSYFNNNGKKAKNLIGIPWRVAFALQENGWCLRQDIIWNKPNPMPESVKDRCTKSHEYIFLLTKNKKYYYDAESIYENKDIIYSFHGSTTSKSGANGDRNDGGRAKIPNKIGGKNKRSVWTVQTTYSKEFHFAVFPEQLIEPCVLAGTKEGDTILDPFNGSGTTGVVALKNNRNYIGIELNKEYLEISEKRLKEEK